VPGGGRWWNPKS